MGSIDVDGDIDGGVMDGFIEGRRVKLGDDEEDGPIQADVMLDGEGINGRINLAESVLLSSLPSVIT